MHRMTKDTMTPGTDFPASAKIMFFEAPPDIDAAVPVSLAPADVHTRKDADCSALTEFIELRTPFDHLSRPHFFSPPQTRIEGVDANGRAAISETPESGHAYQV